MYTTFNAKCCSVHTTVTQYTLRYMIQMLIDKTKILQCKNTLKA